MEELRNEILEFVQDAVTQQGYEFVELKCSLKEKNLLIRIFVDRPGGIQIRECQELSRLVSDYIDREELVKRNYRLEISSPGLDRPLKTEKDFLRNIGREVTVTFRSEKGIQELSGEISATQPSLKLTLSDGSEIEFMYKNIIHGKIILKW